MQKTVLIILKIQMHNFKLLTNKFEIRIFSILGAILVGLLTFSFVLGTQVKRGNVSTPTEVVINPFDKVEIVARSAYVYDVRNNQMLYSKNPNERMPLASLTKVMTAVVALEIVPTYSTIVINQSAIRSNGDSGLRVGERWSLNRLLDFALLTSSNDGVQAVALALGALSQTNPTDKVAVDDFVSQMNKKADEIGMKNTYYFNVTGLDESNQKGGAYGTSEDEAKLFAYALKKHPEIFEATTHKEMRISSLDNIVHLAKNTDVVVNYIPGIKGSKTGFTDLAGGNLVVAFDPELGRPIIISILGSTEKDRFRDMIKLVEASLEKIKTQ